MRLFSKLHSSAMGVSVVGYTVLLTFIGGLVVFSAVDFGEEAEGIIQKPATALVSHGLPGGPAAGDGLGSPVSLVGQGGGPGGPGDPGSGPSAPGGGPGGPGGPGGLGGGPGDDGSPVGPLTPLPVVVEDAGRFYRTFLMIWTETETAPGVFSRQAVAYPYPFWDTPGLYDPGTMPSLTDPLGVGEGVDKGYAVAPNLGLLGWAGAIVEDSETGATYTPTASLCTIADSFNFAMPVLFGDVDFGDIALDGYTTASVAPFQEDLANPPPLFTTHGDGLLSYTDGPLSLQKVGQDSLFVQAFTCSRPSLPGDDPLGGVISDPR